MAWHNRLRNLFRSDKVSNEIDRELSFHVAERTDDLVAAGVAEGEAARRARRQLGNYTVQAERTRDANVITWMESLIQDVKYAVRGLIHSPGFTGAAMISLALGIGANTAIFSLINAVMLKYLPVSHPEELTQIILAPRATTVTNPLWEQVRDRQDVFSGVFAYSNYRFNLARGGEARYELGNFVSGDFFTTLGIKPVQGRLLSPDDDQRGAPALAVLAYSFWQKEYGGDPSIVGKNVSLDNHPFEIIGVAPPGFFGVEVGNSASVFIPIADEPIIRGKGSFLDMRSAWWLQIIGRPQPGVPMDRVNARLATLAPDVMAATLPPNWKPEQKENYLKRTFATQPAGNGLSNLRRQYRDALLILMAACAAVLLIACANIANLLLARGAARQREIAIRLAIGSGRMRLIRQLLTESLVLSLGGAFLGFLFARWGSALLVRLLSSSGQQVFVDLSIDLRVLGFTAAVAVATGLLFGLLPAWRSTALTPQAWMKTGTRGTEEGASRFGIGKALVALQVSLSLVLVVVAGLLVGTFRNVANQDPGFRSDGVLLVNVDLRNGNYPVARRGAVYQEMLDRLRAIPGVTSAASSRFTPISGVMWDDNVQVDGFQPAGEEDNIVYFNRVSDRFFEALGTPLLSGRDFDQHDGVGSPAVAIINQTMAQHLFAGASPLGKQFKIEQGPTLGPPIEVIGVVGDARYQNLRDNVPATAYLAERQNAETDSSISFEVKSTSAAGALVPAVTEAIGQVNPAVTLVCKPFTLQLAESLTRERLLAILSAFFGVLALLLATIGLYGVMSYKITRRRGEIGIRMALGAEQGRVLGMILWEVGVLVVIGLAVGAGVAVATTRLVSEFLYGMKATDPATFGLAIFVLAVTALLAGYLPARRASRLDPMTALREE